MNRRPRLPHNAPHNSEDRQDRRSWVTLICFMAASMLTICGSILFVLNTIDFGPDVGDIVRFQAGQSMSDFARFSVPARYATEDATQSMAALPSASCELHPDVIVRQGGSLVVEASSLTGAGQFRIHWQGQRTAMGAGNCGASADLIVSLGDLRALANVAGGFGVDRKHGIF